MSTKQLSSPSLSTPSIFNDLFKPWNEWFDNSGNLLGRSLSVPAVNITEQPEAYKVSMAVPGMKKEDFRIDVDGNILTISCQKEENKEEKNKKYTRKEYNYSSFSRSFTLPEEVSQEKIEARYEDGVLKLVLPRMDMAKKVSTKKIEVK